VLDGLPIGRTTDVLHALAHAADLAEQAIRVIVLEETSPT